MVRVDRKLHALVEHPSSVALLDLTEELLAAGYAVSGCAGPTRLPPGGCPLLDGKRCSMIDRADVIVNALQADQVRIYRAQRDMVPATPVVLLAEQDHAEQMAEGWGDVVVRPHMISGAALVDVIEGLLAQPPNHAGCTVRRKAMKAQIGDRLVIKGHRIHEPDRDAEILDVRGQDGQPPYLIRWSDSGRETLFFPGVDARIEHLGHDPASTGSTVEVLGQAARDASGKPTLSSDEAVRLVRQHMDLEKLRSSDYDAELWSLWVAEVGRASPTGHNAAVLDRVLDRVRHGE